MERKFMGLVITNAQLDFLRKKAIEISYIESRKVSVVDLIRKSIQAKYPIYDSKKNLIQCK